MGITLPFPIPFPSSIYDGTGTLQSGTIVQRLLKNGDFDNMLCSAMIMTGASQVETWKNKFQTSSSSKRIFIDST